MSIFNELREQLTNAQNDIDYIVIPLNNMWDSLYLNNEKKDMIFLDKSCTDIEDSIENLSDTIMEIRKEINKIKLKIIERKI